MSNKTIKINPVFFQKQNKTVKKDKKPITYNQVNSNKIKNSFIRKIKEFKKSKDDEEKNKIKNISQPIKSENNSELNEFNESIGFITSLIRENKVKKDTKEKIKNPPINLNFEENTKPLNINNNSINNTPIDNTPIDNIIPEEKLEILNNSEKLDSYKLHKKKTVIPKKRKTIKLGKIKNKKIISILIPNENDKKYIFKIVK